MKQLLQSTIDITREAGNIIMGFYQSSFDVTDKKPDNPVTDADFAADAYLKERLSALVPAAGWLSEETVDSAERLKDEFVWVVDPLDGTKEFVMGIPEFSVSVGLVLNGKAVLGVIYNPASDELYAGYRGDGVTLNGKSVTVTKRTELKGSVIDASRSERKRGEFEPFEADMTIKTVGSIAYKLARLAAGQCDASWSRGPKNEWDICAGTFLIKEAGGMMVNLDNEEFIFNQANTLVNGLISDNGRLHTAVIDALAPYRDSARTNSENSRRN